MRRGFFAVGSPVDYRKGDPTGTVGTRLCSAKYSVLHRNNAVTQNRSFESPLRWQCSSAMKRADADTGAGAVATASVVAVFFASPVSMNTTNRKGKTMYAILRFQKKTGGKLLNTQKHNERQKERYKSNPDIDRERSDENIHLKAPPPGGYKRAVLERTEKVGCRLRIRTHGVLSPILVRPTEDGEYEIVSGHRRVFACRRLGLKEVPAIVQPMTREEAVLKMVDSNLHRERLLPSEKAFAYKMKLDAIKHRGKSLSQVATKSDSAAEVGAAMGESRDMVFRYIRLTNLVAPLLDMVDEGKIALMPAERLSYLTEEEQLALADIMEDLEVTPSLSQAVKLKDLSASHRLDPDTMYEVMEKPKANQRETVKLDADTLRRFFPDYTPKQMETAILRMLEEAERERQRQKILRRSRDDAR